MFKTLDDYKKDQKSTSNTFYNQKKKTTKTLILMQEELKGNFLNLNLSGMEVENPNDLDKLVNKAE